MLNVIMLSILFYLFIVLLNVIMVSVVFYGAASLVGNAISQKCL